MQKIIIFIQILFLSTCYPVHAETLIGTATDKIWKTGTILDSWSKEDSIFRFSIVETKNSIWYCRTDIGENNAVNRCHTAKN